MPASSIRVLLACLHWAAGAVADVEATKKGTAIWPKQVREGKEWKQLPRMLTQTVWGGEAHLAKNISRAAC